MNKLQEIFNLYLVKLRTDLAYAAPELQEEKWERFGRAMDHLGEQLYDALGPAADDILEDL